jgi:hypothetical protein
MLPFSVFAEMSQKDVDSLYITPITIEGTAATVNIELPVDSISGYGWFLVDYNYDYIKGVSFEHESHAVEKSKWGGLDIFKMKVHDRFKKIPQKIVLEFECFKPWDTSEIIKKEVIILYVPD